MSTITINATMEVLYYAVGVIGSFKILTDLMEPLDEDIKTPKDEEYFGDNESEYYRKYFDEDGFPIANFDYDKAMYEGNDGYANMVDRKIYDSGDYYDEDYEPEYGQYCEVEEKMPVK